MTLADKLVEHVSNCDVASGSITITDDKLFCIPCNYTAFRSNVKHFLYICIQHFRSDSHKDNCCWTVQRDNTNFSTIKLKSNVIQTLDKYLFCGKIPNKDSYSSSDPSQDVEFVDNSYPSTSRADDYDVASHSCVSIQCSPLIKDAMQQNTVDNSSIHTQCSSSLEDDVKDFLQSDCKMK